MASKNMPVAKKDAKKDAIALLMDDHKRVKGLFDEFKKFEQADAAEYAELKQELMNAVCDELTVHTMIEEEIFYPAVRKALPAEDDLLNEAEVEHGTAKDLIAQIEASKATDPMTCAKFTVLAEYIEHHVKEEHEEMFPKVRRTGIDLDTLGEKMAKRKAELQAEKRPFDESGDDDSSPSLWDRLRSATNIIAPPRV